MIADDDTKSTGFVHKPYRCFFDTYVACFHLHFIMPLKISICPFKFAVTDRFKVILNRLMAH